MKYIRLMRVKHYMKNILVFIPLFFGEEIFKASKFLNALLGTIAFCFISSAVYILNDLQDVNKDRLHPTKKNRPIACGAVSVKNAIIVFSICFLLAIVFAVLTRKMLGLLYIIVYFVLNVLYSFGWKNKPLADILILASGYIIRIFYGGLLTETAISTWLYLVVLSGALYMGLGKRRNEKRRMEMEGMCGEGGRDVLKYYAYSFLDKQMHVCAALANVFYALWAVESSDRCIKWTIPFFWIIMMKYGFDIEDSSDGDPVEVIMQDKVLVYMIFIYGMCLLAFLYFI